MTGGCNATPSDRSIWRKGAEKLDQASLVGCHKQIGLKLYRRRAIDRRPGYHSDYGETTKCASEASDFSVDGLRKT